MKSLKVGIDNYGLQPLNMSPLEILKWAHEKGAEGIQFSGLSLKESQSVDRVYLNSLSDYAREKELYMEWGGAQHIPLDMESWNTKEIYSINKKSVQEASDVGAKVVRSCSGGLMRWDAESPDTETILSATARALKKQKKMFQDHGVTLAVETHFEFTTFELIKLFEMCGAEPGDWIGVCLDTMNLLTMLEEPILAVKRILPWVVSTHIKDGGLILNSEGLVSFPCGIGKGIIDFKKVISLISSLPHEVHLSIEDHGGSFLIPIFNPAFMKGFPDLSLHEFIRLVHLEEKTKEAEDKDGLSITPREKWPELCEERMKKNIKALKKIRDEFKKS